MRFCWKAGAVLLALVWVAGCGNNDTNPIGGSLLERNAGEVREVPELSLAGGRSKYEISLPIIKGQAPEMMVGRMHGIAVRSLLRFLVPANELARSVGGQGAQDLRVESIRILLQLETLKNQGEISVEAPGRAWEELSVFVDTLQFVELDFPSAPIAGADAQVQGDSLWVNLPAGYAENAISENPSSAAIQVLLAPSGAGEFVYELIARDNTDPEVIDRWPILELVYSVQGQTATVRYEASADTYWAARIDGGPPADLLVVESGIRFQSVLRFDVGGIIPEGATVNLASLELDLDADRSFFDTFVLRVDRVNVSSTTGDTTYTNYGNPAFDSTEPSLSILLDPTLVQSWISGVIPNNGVALRPQAETGYSWVLIQNARLKLVYSTPPEVE